MVNDIYSTCLTNNKGCLVLSFGVTNSGKTYTILGKENDPGILPMLIDKFEREIPDQPIYIRAMEVYTDDIYCLTGGEKLIAKEGNYGY